jgi:poly-gamma-glutamate synthesis protein (capsule biosynthesis protein)
MRIVQANAADDTPATAQGEITLAAVGDIMLARSIGAALRRDPTNSPFASVVEHLRAADVTVGNLECALGTGGQRARKSYTFLAPPEGAASLAGAGFNVVSLANNHSLDFGPQALESTQRLLDAADVRHVGAGRDRAQAHHPVLLNVKGMRLAFLAYVNTPAEGSYHRATWEATEERPGVAWGMADEIKADVAAAKAQADIVIALLHSGSEGRDRPSTTQRNLARAAIDGGAALVVGAHPHVLQGVERYDSGVIAYSLGNFVFDGFRGAANESAILRVTLGRDGVRDLTWTPVVIQRGRPQLAQGRQAQRILARIVRLSAQLPH